MNLIRFLIRRILTGIVVLWAVSTATFILFFARPVGIVGRELAGRAASPAVINETIRQLGLNQPLVTQYWHFIDNLLHGKLGYSFYSGESVNAIIKQDLPPTASIVFGGVILWLVIGLGVGILSATRARSLFDRVSTVGVLVGISMPVFVLGELLLLLVFLPLNQHGITCFVLKYRLGSHGYHYPVEFQDGTRAVRWVRTHAADYKIDPQRVGIMGSSAGGHLASMVLTHFDAGDKNSPDPVERQSSRPDIVILCYPVITMGEYTHQGSKDNLLGRNPPPELVKSLSSELQVTSSTPPCFIWCTYEDKTVPMENTLMFAEALRKSHVPFALHVYEKGGHGMGLADKPPFAHPHPWAGDCLFWLKAQGFVK